MGSAASCKAPSKYGHQTSSDVIMHDFGVNADGKHVIVTGSNSGLGFETARSLAKYGAIVTIACRSEKNGLEAVAKIKIEVVGAQVSFLPLDLASLSSVRAFAAEYKSSGKPLHFLVNNAGVMACPKTFTADGLEMQFGVNHIGHFLLTTELLDLLKSSGTVSNPSRVVTLSSYAPFLFAPSVGIRMDDLKGEKNYHAWERYGSSKLANIIFTKELDRRCTSDFVPSKSEKESNLEIDTNSSLQINKGQTLQSTTVIAVAVNPGTITGTNLKRHMDFGSALELLSRIYTSPAKLHTMLVGEPNKSIKQGSATTLICLLDPETISGEFYANCNIKRNELHPKMNDIELAKKLWEMSQSIVELTIDQQ